MDGGEPKRIAAKPVMNYCITGDWLYYLDQNNRNAIWRVHTDGTADEEYLRLDTPIATFNISGDTIYLGCGISHEADCFFITNEIITMDLTTLSKLQHIYADTEPICVGPDGRIYFFSYGEGMEWYAMDNDGKVSKVE